MAVSRWVATACLTVGCLTVAPSLAHHASAPFYDDTRSVEALGVVTRFEFKNPHSFLYLAGSGDGGGTIDWEIEMGPAVSMTRRGWTPDTINAGDEIRAVGRPSRAPGTYGMCCAELTRSDGSPIQP